MWIFFYFFLLIFIGSFFLLQLTLAVIKAKFTDQHDEGQEGDNNEEDDEDACPHVEELKEYKKGLRARQRQSYQEPREPVQFDFAWEDLMERKDEIKLCFKKQLQLERQQEALQKYRDRQRK